MIVVNWQINQLKLSIKDRFIVCSIELMLSEKNKMFSLPGREHTTE
jgi:hypothetical protein